MSATGNQARCENRGHQRHARTPGLDGAAVRRVPLRGRRDVPQHAVLVPGNHDACFEQLPEPALALFPAQVHVLLQEPLVLDGVRFFGSPWTPPFLRWHFMAVEERLAVLDASMPAAVDVLVTHGPSRGVLDPGWRTTHAGSTALAEAVGSRTVRPSTTWLRATKSTAWCTRRGFLTCGRRASSVAAWKPDGVQALRPAAGLRR